MLLTRKQFNSIQDYVGQKYLNNRWWCYDVTINHLIHYVDNYTRALKRTLFDNCDGPKYALYLDILEFIDDLKVSQEHLDNTRENHEMSWRSSKCLEASGDHTSVLVAVDGIPGLPFDVYDEIEVLILTDTLLTEELFDVLNSDMFPALQELHIESRYKYSDGVQRLILRIPSLERLGLYHRNTQMIILELEDMIRLKYLNIPRLTAHDSFGTRSIRLEFDLNNFDQLEYLSLNSTVLNIEQCDRLEHLGLASCDIWRYPSQLKSLELGSYTDYSMIPQGLEYLSISVKSPSDLNHLPSSIKVLHVEFKDDIVFKDEPYWNNIEQLKILSLHLSYTSKVQILEFNLNKLKDLQVFMVDHNIRMMKWIQRIRSSDINKFQGTIGISYVIADDMSISINDPPRIFQSTILSNPDHEDRLRHLLRRSYILSRPLLYSFLSRQLY